MKRIELLIFICLLNMCYVHVQDAEGSAMLRSSFESSFQASMGKVKSCSSFFGGVGRSSGDGPVSRSGCPENYRYEKMNRCYGLQKIRGIAVSEILDDIKEANGEPKTGKSRSALSSPNRKYFKPVRDRCANECNKTEECKVFGFHRLCEGKKLSRDSSAPCIVDMKRDLKAKDCILWGIEEGGDDLRLFVHVCVKGSHSVSLYLLIKYNIMKIAYHVDSNI